MKCDTRRSTWVRGKTPSGIIERENAFPWKVTWDGRERGGVGDGGGRVVGTTGVVVVGQPEMTGDGGADRVLPWGDSIRDGGIGVQPVATPHTDAHVSYRVLWGGRRLYFSGDTESIDEILQERDLDVAFVSPWLLRAVLEAGQTIDTELIVVYHHRAGEEVPTGPGIHVPTQRGRFVIR